MPNKSSGRLAGASHPNGEVAGSILATGESADVFTTRSADCFQKSVADLRTSSINGSNAVRGLMDQLRSRRLQQTMLVGQHVNHPSSTVAIAITTKRTNEKPGKNCEFKSSIVRTRRLKVISSNPSRLIRKRNTGSKLGSFWFEDNARTATISPPVHDLSHVL
ncbi:hypothetical protein EVAR_61853_1 [Eumeta japonica]|uniref:Uncharacterized protein n=1 Tax=Eumeta variegata TaxID=151549 RepID=A0A4C1ZFW4_EUMVA|nr:hypothetical protein EVAR_61853_1 [Eumeta japonica]